MHNLSDRGLFVVDLRLGLENLGVTDSTDTVKPKASCYGA